MDDSSLTGAQRAFLRGLGQRLDATLKLGREGVTPAVVSELERLLLAHELVKVRFVNADRDERAAACARVAEALRCLCVGAVGHTALFYRANASADDRRVVFPG
jgi:RNA-binding protein